MARSIRRSAASTVLPVATQPGRSGTDAPQSLPGSLSMRTRYWNFLMRVLAADLPGAAPRPAFPSASRPRMTADGHPTGFRGVLEMPVTPPTDHQPPAVCLDQTDHVPHLHCHTHPLFPTATAAAALWRRRKSTLLDGPSWGQAAHLSSIGMSAERCVNALRPPRAQEPPVRYDQSPPAREEPECTAGSFRLSTPTRAAYPLPMRNHPLASTLLAAALVTAAASAASAAVLRVGTLNGQAGDFTSIQDAVDAASPGDWILIAPGDYHERGDYTHALPGRDAAGAVLIPKPNLH